MEGRGKATQTQPCRDRPHMVSRPTMATGVAGPGWQPPEGDRVQQSCQPEGPKPAALGLTLPHLSGPQSCLPLLPQVAGPEHGAKVYPWLCSDWGITSHRLGPSKLKGFLRPAKENTKWTRLPCLLCRLHPWPQRRNTHALCVLTQPPATLGHRPRTTMSSSTHGLVGHMTSQGDHPCACDEK